MLRRLSLALGAALALGLHAVPAAAAPAASIAIVQGLSEGDLLNMRATASPVGKVETRMPNGKALKKFGCDLVDGYEWCEVEDTENANLRGWVPSRYLQDAGPADDSQAAAAPATGMEDAPDDPTAAKPQADGGARMEVPADLTARLDASQPAPASDAEKKTADAVRKAMQEAYATAPAPVETKAPSPDASAEGDTDAGADVPVPTPRPGETDAEIRTARAVQPDQPATTGATASFSGEIPCARYLGQPMTHCAASVARKGADAADVTVTWPDGGTRVINFHDGNPAGSNSRADFRFTREGTLNMIRIGQSERFEITDALAFGD